MAVGWSSHPQSLCGSYLWSLTVPVMGTLLQSAECGPHGLRNNICQEYIGLKEFVTTEGTVQFVEVGCKREREQGLGKRKLNEQHGQIPPCLAHHKLVLDILRLSNFILFLERKKSKMV